MFVDSKAQFFKTAKQLRIDERAYDALVEVRRRMLTGEIKDEQFNYQYWMMDRSPCGTACCIGGWIDIILSGCATTSPTVDEPNRPLHSLFYRGFSRGNNGRTPTMAMGIQAMENYLTTGWPRWKEVWKATK